MAELLMPLDADTVAGVRSEALSGEQIEPTWKAGSFELFGPLTPWPAWDRDGVADKEHAPPWPTLYLGPPSKSPRRSSAAAARRVCSAL